MPVCSKQHCLLDLLSCLEAHSIRPGWRQADLRPRGRASRCLGMPGAQKIGGKGESSCEHTLHGDPPGAWAALSRAQPCKMPCTAQFLYNSVTQHTLIPIQLSPYTTHSNAEFRMSLAITLHARNCPTSMPSAKHCLIPGPVHVALLFNVSMPICGA